MTGFRLERRIAHHWIDRFNSHGEDHWECLFFGGISSVDCMSDWRGVLDCPTKIMIGDDSSLAHPTDIFVRVNISDMDMKLHSGSPGLCSLGFFYHGMREMWHLFGFLSDLPDFPDTGDPDSSLRMPKSRYDFRDVSMNRSVGFSARRMCFRALIPEFDLKKCALTLSVLPVRREWPGWEQPAGAEGVTGVEGIAGEERFASGERFSGAEGSDSSEDWGYIKQVTGGASPFCVQPVTGSHLLGSPIGCVLSL